MGKSKSTITVTLTLDDNLIASIDREVQKALYPDRSLAIQEAIERRYGLRDKSFLERELAKLDPIEERRMADEFLPRDESEWPEY